MDYCKNNSSQSISSYSQNAIYSTSSNEIIGFHSPYIHERQNFKFNGN